MRACELFLLRRPGARPPALREGAEQHEVAHSFWMAHGIGDRHWSALRDAEQGEPVGSCGVHDGLEILDPVVERDSRHVPVG